MRLVHRKFTAVTAMVAAFAVLPSVVRADDDDPRVHLRLAEGITQPFDAVSQTLEAALADAGWNVLSTMDCGVLVEQCDFASRVIVAYTDAHRARLMPYGNHAAYALPIKFVIYEDEDGIGIGSTNPMNLYRTIVDEETEPEDWADISAEIRAVVTGAFPEHAVDTEYGQRRGKARIGRTMGVMAGGRFKGKFKEVVTRLANGDDAISIANRIFDELSSIDGDWQWGIRPIYVIDLPENDMALVGVTGSLMETRSAGIVKHGGMNDRKDMACPGIDHLAAYPLEVVVQIVDGELQVRMVDVMYRMKMFFENAGKMAFMRNMGMPGSIEDEVKDKIRAVLN